MIDRVSDTFGIKPERLIADTAYGKGEMLDWLDRQRGIAPHIPVIDKSGRKDGTFERASTLSMTLSRTSIPVRAERN